jgi:lytic murein transglycosylase
MTTRPAALRIAACLAALLWAFAAGTEGAGRATAERQFAAFLASLWPEARAQGVSRSVFDAAFKGLTLDWSLPDLDPRITGAKETGERRQAEFSSPGRYFDEAAIARLAADGRALAKTWGKALARIEKTYGVPAEILLAMWARESNYGRAAIPYDALRNLATLSFVGRRKEHFRPELIAALLILEQGHIARDKLKSSWAGALGHMQMLPSQFLAHAVDFDGDGRKDIWGSVPDALASAANFMRHKGWLPHEAWGYEARLPADFDCTLEGPDGRRPLGAWLKLGAAAAGRPIPSARFTDESFLIMPAGRYGPAFLATRNYYVIKSYNESDLYVIFIGHLADRIAGGRPFAARWGNVSTYTRGEVAALQKKLVAEGYDVGERIDGLIGFRTRVATGLYQKKHGLAFDCWPGPQVLAHAGVR